MKLTKKQLQLQVLSEDLEELLSLAIKDDVFYVFEENTPAFTKLIEARMKKGSYVVPQGATFNGIKGCVLDKLDFSQIDFNGDPEITVSENNPNVLYGTRKCKIKKNDEEIEGTIIYQIALGSQGWKFHVLVRCVLGDFPVFQTTARTNAKTFQKSNDINYCNILVWDQDITLYNGDVISLTHGTAGKGGDVVFRTGT